MADVVTRVVLDERGIQEIAVGPGAVALLLQVGEEIARIGGGLAARRTGAGARSFHAEWVGDAAHVSWDDVHYYMYFHEFGASNTPAQPALSLAIDIVKL
jgi:hypothetical protein